MEKTENMLKQTFESSSSRTPQYLDFHRTFKREVKNLLKPYINRFEVFKPNHFDAGGFFELKNGKIFYFSLSDLRWDKTFLIRTAKDFKDYTGGSNQYLDIDDLGNNLLSFVEREI